MIDDAPIEPPYRLCCGQRHWGVACPDGLVMCCICYYRFPISELTQEPDGYKVDVCMGCTIDEAYALERLREARTNDSTC